MRYVMCYVLLVDARKHLRGDGTVMIHRRLQGNLAAAKSTHQCH